MSTPPIRTVPVDYDVILADLQDQIEHLTEIVERHQQLLNSFGIDQSSATTPRARG